MISDSTTEISASDLTTDCKASKKKIFLSLIPVLITPYNVQKNGKKRKVRNERRKKYF